MQKSLAELGNAPQYDTLMMQIIAWLCNIFMQEVLVQPPRIGISAYKPLILGSFWFLKNTDSGIIGTKIVLSSIKTNDIHHLCDFFSKPYLFHKKVWLTCCKNDIYCTTDYVNQIALRINWSVKPPGEFAFARKTAPYLDCDRLRITSDGAMVQYLSQSIYHA